MASKAELKCVISADARAFYRAMGEVRKESVVIGKGVVGGMAAGTAAVVGAWGVALHKLIEYGGAVMDLSERTGLGVAFVQELGYAAQLTGSSLDDVQTGMRGLANVLQAAGTTGGGAARKAFKDLGLSWRELAAMKPDQQLAAVLTAIGKIEDPTKRVAMANDILGRSGIRLVPLATQYEELTTEARKMGVGLSGETLEAAEQLERALERVGFRVRGAAFGAVAPDVQRFADALNSIALDPALWEAVAAPMRTVAQAIGDMGIGMVEMLKNRDNLAVFATTLQNVGDGFSYQLDNLSKLMKLMVPFLTIINFGEEKLRAMLEYMQPARGQSIANEGANRFTGAQVTQAALELRTAGITVNNTPQEQYLAMMNGHLQRIADAVTPLAPEI